MLGGGSTGRGVRDPRTPSHARRVRPGPVSQEGPCERCRVGAAARPPARPSAQVDVKSHAHTDILLPVPPVETAGDQLRVVGHRALCLRRSPMPTGDGA